MYIHTLNTKKEHEHEVRATQVIYKKGGQLLIYILPFFYFTTVTKELRWNYVLHNLRCFLAYLLAFCRSSNVST